MKRLSIAAAALLYSGPAMATGFSCGGNVAYLGINGNGDVNIDIGNGVWAICNLTTNSAGITPQACTAWYSGVLTAKASAKQVVLYFNSDANSGITTCPALGTWVARTPYFMELQ